MLFHCAENGSVTMGPEVHKGIGNVTMSRWNVEKYPPHVRTVGVMEIEPGNGWGIHTHVGEAEFYYIAEGVGTVVDGQGNKETALTGDLNICYDGETHAIYNEGTQRLKIVYFFSTTA